jgi:hypothetical protein
MLPKKTAPAGISALVPACSDAEARRFMWADLYERTSGLRGPLLFSPPFPLPVTFDEIAAILKGARDAPGSTKLNYFRGYVEGREDYDLARRFLQSENLESDHIVATISQAFDLNQGHYGKRAGLIVNGGLRWSHEVHERLTPHAEAFRALSPGTVTVDVTLFIGAYGSTPFGAHVDDSTHRTIIFNLGPRDKDVSIWPRDAVEAQFGPVRNIMDPSTIHVRPTSFSMRSGDALVLPSDEFHVAYNNEVSTAVAIVIDNVSDSRLAERELALQRSDLDESGLTGDFGQLTLARLAAMGRQRARSNGGLRYPPPSHPAPTHGLQRHSMLRVDSRWPILVERVGSFAVIYARGRHLRTRSMEGAVEMLNRSGSATINSFLEIGIADGSDLVSGLRVISFLLDGRAAFLE